MSRCNFCVSACVAYFVALSVSAATVYDNLSLVIIPQWEVAPSDNNRRFAQQFLIGDLTRVDEVAVRLTRMGVPSGFLTLELWDDSDMGTPREKLDELGTITNVGQIGTEHMDFAFQNSVGNLTPQSAYWVVLNFANATLSEGETIAWSAFAGSGGTNGASTAAVSVDGGASWVNSPIPYFAMAVEASLMGDFNGNGMLDVSDIEELVRQSAIMLHDPLYDLNRDSMVDATDVRIWIRDVFQSWVGDANLDGEFNSTDLVAVFTAGEYEDTIDDNSGWAEGDWNGDRDFDSGDLVAAFQDAGYELGPRQLAAPVPEASGGWLLSAGIMTLAAAARFKGVRFIFRGGLRGLG